MSGHDKAFRSLFRRVVRIRPDGFLELRTVNGKLVSCVERLMALQEPMPKLDFLKSAVKLTDFPIDDLPEVAFAGRSNAGKSSLINALARTRIAQVSSTPGKTRLLNLFTHQEKYRIVDMPGYGYAARDGDEVKSWKTMIETFLLRRENLRAIVLIMDIRRGWEAEEQMLFNLALKKDIHFAVILNKSDKLSKSATIIKKNKINQDVKPEFCLPFSVLNKTGVKELENKLFDWLRGDMTKASGDANNTRS
jgi:GTP-binding protein